MVEDPDSPEVKESENPLPPALAPPDEVRWWELQLGFALPSGLRPNPQS